MMAEFAFCLLMAAAAYVTSYFQFKEKGLLLNNAWFYASKEERLKMDKTPHYHQSGVIFSLMGTIFLLITIQIATGLKWVFYTYIAVIIATVIYAVVSSIRTERKR
ncbi:MAG: DUF3784 domain-containing protein [Coprococcus sp.]|nr:DUF3784 domain-containing protein [Coprococcus sp.]